MRCSDVEHLLPQYTDGALPASQAESIASHLADCAACRRELALLQRSLETLNRVAREPVPDLWGQFQARLAQSSAAALCREMETLLPSYAERNLERAERARVRQHLAECEACARLEASCSRPFRALEQLAAEPAPVDLWPSFAARLAATLSCAEVEAELPALLAGEAVRNRLAHQAHLASCTSCAASVAAYDRSLAALSRTAQAIPDVDLWPAFDERLRSRGSNAPRRPVGWLPALGAWMRGPLLQPALGFAAFALLTLAGNLVSHAVNTQRRGAKLAAEAPQRSRQVAVNEEPRTATLLAARPAAPRPELPRAVSAKRAVRPAPVSEQDHKPQIRSVKSVVVAKSVPEPATPASPPAVRVAFNLPAAGMRDIAASDPIFSTEPEPGTPADRDGMQAVVQAVELLAGSEDALHSPFDF
jgi:anti-sigma factor RsiW